VQHLLDQCPDILCTAVVTDITRFEKVWFKKFASCTDCGVAQKICTRWQETYKGSCRFKPIPGRGCQDKTIIQPAIAAMISARPIKVVKVGLFQPIREEKI
jgi:hypothetical protein